MKVHSYTEFREALESDDRTIELCNSVIMPEGFVLGKGRRLVAGGENVFLGFINGGGIALRGDNEISGIAIQTEPSSRAIYIDSAEEDLGKIVLRSLTVTGVVQFLTRGGNRRLRVDVDGLDIVSADARALSEKPMKYGVTVHQGAFTVYNYNPDDDSSIVLLAENVSVGRRNAPVLGSGIFVSGFGDSGGSVEVENLTTGEVHSNGMIPSGQPNLITGGIFIVYGAHAKKIISEDTVATYGTNDMVLDVWGSVDSWTVKGEVVSYGASGIGFVNFGTVGKFRAEKGLRTLGPGARGFNQYDGTIEDAYFESISTAGDGSVGMQFSRPVGNITLGRGITTTGSVGKTLVKGVITELHADAVSVLAGGSIRKLTVRGDITAEGRDVVALHVNGGTIDEVSLGGKLVAPDPGSKELVIENGGKAEGESLRRYA